MLKKIMYVLIAIFVVIQFIRPKKNSSAQTTDYSYMPAEVQTIMKKACFDCHSNNTVYPWYSNIQPIGWWLANHVNEGKRRLNFDDFNNSKKKDDIGETIQKGEMPLWSYTLIHRNALLNDQEKQTVLNWAKQFEDGESSNKGESNSEIGESDEKEEH